MLRKSGNDVRDEISALAVFARRDDKIIQGLLR